MSFKPQKSSLTWGSFEGGVGGLIRSQKRVYDDVTGQVFSDKERTFPPHFDDAAGYLFWHRKQHARTYMDVDFPDSLTMEDIGRVTCLSKRIWSQTNMLGYRGNGGARPYTPEQLAPVVRLTVGQMRRFLSRMVRAGVMAKVRVQVGSQDEVQWYINPVYFFSSNRLPLNLYLIFRERMNEVLPEWVVQRFGEVHQLRVRK